MENNPQSEKSFRISPGKKYGYGELAGIFLLLVGVFNMFSEKWYSLGVFMIFITAIIEKVLAAMFFYFLVLWIMKLVRNRGKIERPENKKTKKIITIIFIILLLGTIISTGLSISRAVSSSKVSPEQTSFINTLLAKFQEFSAESDGVKVAMQAFIDVASKKEYSKFHEALKNLLSATQAIQPKIDELKIFSQQGINLSKNEKGQAVFNLYLKAIDLRDQDNKKLIEMATFGLTIDWENPTETQMTKWAQLAKELGVIESEIQSTQAEFKTSS